MGVFAILMLVTVLLTKKQEYYDEEDKMGEFYGNLREGLRKHNKENGH
jgi:hypothetical protein